MPRQLNILSLCSGVGALDLGVMDVIGGTVIGHAQYDPDDKHQWAAQILAHRFPGVPNYGDITAADWTPLAGSVDVITAGFPCQDISLAGFKAGLMPGTRSGIWSHVMRAIAALRPSLVVIENVRSLLSARAHSDVELCPWCLGDEPDQLALRGLGAVLGDLADGGFDAEWRCVPASDVGAPHLRWRVFVLAWPADAQGAGLEARRQGRPGGGAASVALGVGTPADPEGDGRDQRRTEPARLVRRPDAAVGSGATPADAARIPEREPADHPHPVAGSREARPEPVDRSLPDRERERERGRLRDQAAADTPHDRRQRGRDSRDRRTGPAHHDQQPDVDWGPYTAAVRRWEAVTGRPAPTPTEPGKNGPRLSPALPEWMMGMPAGWVTDVPGIPRNAQLHAIGNGVAPAQASHALLPLLAARNAALAGSAA